MLRKVAWSLVVVGVVASLVVGALRWTQTKRIFAAADLSFGPTNNLSWNPTSGVLSTLGPDPHAVLEVPDASLPLRALRLEFFGKARPNGPSYIYPTPVGTPGLLLDGSLVKTAEVIETSAGFVLAWQLDDARVVRFDFPDEVAGPWLLKSVVMESPFAAGANSTFVLFALLVGATAVGALILGLAQFGNARTITVVTALLVVVAKLLLAQDVGVAIITNLIHDDRLFLDQAIELSEGRWLGEFNSLTLSKGPVYPLFLAAIARMGLSLQSAQAWFHALSCAVLVWAIFPWVRRPWLGLFLFAVLLLDPQMLSANTTGRVLRSGINPSLTLFVIAGALGVVARAGARGRAWWGWLGLTGVAWTFFWHSREESIWLAPSLGLLLLTAAGVMVWNQPSKTRRWLKPTLLLFPVLTLLAGSHWLRSQNDRAYGIRLTEDVREGSFPAAYASILRVLPQSPVEGVQVTQDVRESLYRESPAFARLREQMEGVVLHSWSQLGWSDYEGEPPPGEIRSGWFQWALRDAAERSGVYETAASAQEYWTVLAHEINAASDDGRLNATGPRSGMFPRWETGYTGRAFAAWIEAWRILVRFDDFSVSPPPSSGSAEELEQLGAAIGTKPHLTNSPATVFTQTRIALHQVYSWLGPLLLLSGLLGTVVILWRSLRQPHARAYLAVVASLWGGVTALTLITALVEITSFPALRMMYLGAAVPLFLIVGILAPLLACEAPRDDSRA